MGTLSLNVDAPQIERAGKVSMSIQLLTINGGKQKLFIIAK